MMSAVLRMGPAGTRASFIAAITSAELWLPTQASITCKWVRQVQRVGWGVRYCSKDEWGAGE